MNDDGNNQQRGIVAGDSSGSSSSSNNAPLQDAAVISGSSRRPPSPQESRVSLQDNRIGMIRFPAQPPLAATEETAAGKRKRGGRSYDPGSGSGSSRMKFDGPDMVSPCSVCGKRFGSWKAVFGHMRSHPDRSWRGVHPPPTFNREGSPDHQGPRDSSKSASVAGTAVAGGEGEETGAYLLRLATQVQSNMEKGQRLRSSGSAGEEETSPEDPSTALHVAGASPTRPRRELDLDLNQPYIQNPSTPSSEDTQGFSLDLNFPPASPQS